MNKFDTHRIQHVRYLDIYRHIKEVVATSDAQGFQICSIKKHNIHIGSSVFTCKFGQHILDLYVCDDIIDCPNDDSHEVTCGPAENKRFAGKMADVLYYITGITKVPVLNM